MLTKNLPSVSIIFPLRNESAFIVSVLTAILLQDYPSKCLEILIAEGMSIDNTRQIVSNFESLYPQLQINVLDNPSKIVSTGMNIALRHAKGEIIIRVDGHTVIAPDYIRRCVEALQRTHADNVGGKMCAIGYNPFGRAVALATSTPFGVGGSRFHYSDKEEWVDTVYMGAWPRGVFEKIGLFDEELVRDQDDELNYRLRAAGGKVLLSPTIKSEYAVRSTPKALWRQYFQYGFWKVRVLQKHPLQMSLRQFVPPAFVLDLLVSIPLALSPKTRSLSTVVPLFYLFANSIIAFWVSFKRGSKLLGLLPFAFTILHLSYGFGFLLGLVNFWNRWGDKIGKTPNWQNEIDG